MANDIADVTLRLDRAVAVDPYAENRETGSLILIDRESTDTAALGLVQAPKATTTAGGDERPTKPSNREAPRSSRPACSAR